MDHLSDEPSSVCAISFDTSLIYPLPTPDMGTIDRRSVTLYESRIPSLSGQTYGQIDLSG